MNALNARPVGSNVLIAPDPPVVVSAGGIFLPEAAPNLPEWGTVLAAGPGAFDDAGVRHAMTVREGDRVMFVRWGGHEYRHGNDEYVIVDESLILGQADPGVSVAHG